MSCLMFTVGEILRDIKDYSAVSSPTECFYVTDKLLYWFIVNFLGVFV